MNKIRLICTKYGTDLISIPIATSYETKWHHVLAYPVGPVASWVEKSEGGKLQCSDRQLQIFDRRDYVC